MDRSAKESVSQSGRSFNMSTRDATVGMSVTLFTRRGRYDMASYQ
jgi:hypothetical protein